MLIHQYSVLPFCLLCLPYLRPMLPVALQKVTMTKEKARKIRIRRRVGGALAITTIFLLGLALATRPTSGQQKEGATKDQLIGTGMLVSAQNEKKAEIFGPHPVGMLVFDASGHFTSQVMRGDLPKFASPNRTKATPEESQAVIRGYIAYFGTYTVTAPGTLSLHIISGSFPNWNGADQQRSFVINGDELQYTNLATSFGDASAHLLWKRVSAAQ